MIDIIVVSSDGNKRFSGQLNKFLSKYYKTSVYQNNSYIRNNNEIDFLIIDTLNINEIKSEKAVVIFSGEVEENRTINISDDIVAVANSENKNSLKIISENKIKAITCGLSSKDTVTISSVTEETAVISLQRNITSFSGEIIEPIEILVKLEEAYSVSDLLMIVSVFLLIDSEKFLLQN